MERELEKRQIKDKDLLSKSMAVRTMAAAWSDGGRGERMALLSD